MLRSALRHAYGEVPMLTPTSGDVLPHFWQRKPMLPMKVFRLTPLRRRSRGNGKSVIRPQVQVSRKNV